MLLLLDCTFTACSTTVARNVLAESSPSHRARGSQRGREQQWKHTKDLDVGYASIKKKKKSIKWLVWLCQTQSHPTQRIKWVPPLVHCQLWKINFMDQNWNLHLSEWLGKIQENILLELGSVLIKNHSSYFTNWKIKTKQVCTGGLERENAMNTHFYKP